MKIFMVLAPAISIAMTYMMYRREDDLIKVIISFLLLWAIITLGLLGTVMLSIKPLYLTHWFAITIAYGGMVYYILKGKLLWSVLVMPMITMLIYLVLAWLGNEHLPSGI